jgi:hypothetical protein
VPNNYWCTTDSIAIEQMIYDGYDNTNYGLVNFMPVNVTQCILATGILTNEIQSLSFRIFPNPASDYLEVELAPNIFNGEVKIFNSLGESAYSATITKPKININISNLKSGAYIIQISNGETTKFVKFIKV